MYDRVNNKRGGGRIGPVGLTVMIRTLFSLGTKFLIGLVVITILLGFIWLFQQPYLANQAAVLMPLSILVALIITAYFKRFGSAHVYQRIGLINRRIVAQSTLWLTGLITTGLMLVAGIMWGLFGRLPH